MSKLEELIEQYCPDGVEWKPLAECCNILDGKRKPITKGARQSGPYPYYGANGIQDWVADYIFDGTYVLIGEDGSVITPNGTPIVNWAHGKIWVNNHAHIIAETTGVLLRFLFYYIQIIDIHNLVHGNIPKLTQGDLKEIEIPVPPLPVQEEIVRILDAFTELQAELQAELQKRKQQYNYYLDNLLNFKDINRGGYQAEVRWMKIGDICDVFTGGEVPMGSIKGNTSFGSFIYPIWGNGKDIYGYATTYQIDKDAVCISSIGANSGAVFFHKAYFTPIIRLKVLIPRNQGISVRYLFYILSFVGFDVKKSSVPNMNSNEVKQKVIPIPSLVEQQRIVSILDRFDTLTTDLTQGLPAEIEKRRQQYEYYRDKLLTFKRKGA